MKRCFKCNCEKPMAEFYAHAKMADGRLNKCKECTKAAVTANRLLNLDRLREYDRRRSSAPIRVQARRDYSLTPEGRASHVWANDAWRQRNKEKQAAHNAVAKAILRCKLKRKPCERCGSAPAQAHHPDYSKPLDVVWLCDPHHKEAHRA